MTTHKLEKLPFYTLLIFIVAGSIGAGCFYTRSFLTLTAVLYGVTAALEAIKVSLLLPVSLLFSSLSGKRRDQIWSAWAWSGAVLTLWGLAFGLFVREGWNQRSVMRMFFAVLNTAKWITIIGL